jgi:hypothetical protein
MTIAHPGIGASFAASSSERSAIGSCFDMGASCFGVESQPNKPRLLTRLLRSDAAGRDIGISRNIHAGA